MGTDQQTDFLEDWPQASVGFPDIPKKEPFVPESDDHQFFADCSAFDWYYNFSDDHSVWKRGESGIRTLKGRITSDKRQQIFDDWNMYKFSGVNFGTEQTPQPVWSDYA